MTTRRQITEFHGVYFITFTCYKWLPLFVEANGYHAVYKWFDHLKKNGHYILAYVIMPNHVHVLIAFRHTQNESINRIVSNGKRFMAYAIVKGLEENDKQSTLEVLNQAVRINEKRRGKLHEVFEPSFDWKKCESDKFIIQKLEYIHKNPCRGKWNLAEKEEDYMHCSAFFYVTGQQGNYEVTSYGLLDDLDLAIPKLD